jgi:hypothetical protein
MKFEQFSQPKIQLDEVRMGQSDLDSFVNSQEAQGIKAGFEAELCFTNLGGSDPDYDNPEEDYDSDTTADSIEEICDFFYDGDYNGRREIQALREELQERYWEWRSERLSEAWDEVREEKVREYIEENDWDEDEEIKNYLVDELDVDEARVEEVIKADSVENPEDRALYVEAVDQVSEKLDELVQEALDEENRSYDRAREEWEEYHEDSFDERDWIRDCGVRYMSDVPNEFNSRNVSISWPHYRYPESETGFNESAAGQLAQSLRNAMDIEVKVGSGYHSVKRTATRWIIEADSSLEADDGDMPAEIVSPPMPLDVCLEKMDEFWEWAIANEAYTNDSTGLHVGVSLPHVGGEVDYVKLALFLGDKYVLEQFGRNGNYYCKSSFDKIKDGSDSGRVTTAFEIIRKGLIELATKTLKQTSGHGKYSSINMKGDYIEFRSMGGDDYLNKLDEVKNTVKRYAFAMYIASRPDLHREEYAKKLYKILSKSGDLTTIQLFSQFKSGILSKEELKRELKNRQDTRAVDKQPAHADGWQIFNRSNNTVVAEFLAPSREHATQKFYDYIQQRNANPLNFLLRRSSEGQAQPNLPTPQNQTSGGFTGEWKVVDSNGREVYRFSGVGNSQTDANSTAARWLIRQGITNTSNYEVYPVMGSSN